MKRCISVLILFTMLISLSACGTATKPSGNIVSDSDEMHPIQIDEAVPESNIVEPLTKSGRVIYISADTSTSVAITEDHALWMWGCNINGQIGNGSKDNVYSPVKVLENVSSVILNSGTVAVIKTDGSLWMWGNNVYGQIGNGSTDDVVIPTEIMSDVSEIHISHYGTVAAIKTDGSLWTWGFNAQGQVGNGTTENVYYPVNVLNQVSKLFLDLSVYAIQTDGSLYAWGNNSRGELGTGKMVQIDRSTTMNADGLVPEKILDNVVDLRSSHSEKRAALMNDGTLWVWGPEGSNTPVKEFDDVSSFDVGDYIIAAVRNDGSLWLWGENSYGLLGGASSSDVPIKIMNQVKQLCFGDDFAAAIDINGDLYMWGYDENGMLGNEEGNATNFVGNSIQTNPDFILGQVKYVSIQSVSVFSIQTFAIKENGDLYTWGDLRLGINKTYSPTKLLEDVDTFTSTYNKLMVLQNDGSVWMCGTENKFGQLGNGTTAPSGTLIKIMGN